MAETGDRQVETCTVQTREPPRHFTTSTNDHTWTAGPVLTGRVDKNRWGFSDAVQPATIFLAPRQKRDAHLVRRQHGMGWGMKTARSPGCVSPRVQKGTRRGFSVAVCNWQIVASGVISTLYPGPYRLDPGRYLGIYVSRYLGTYLHTQGRGTRTRTGAGCGSTLGAHPTYSHAAQSGVRIWYANDTHYCWEHEKILDAVRPRTKYPGNAQRVSRYSSVLGAWAPGQLRRGREKKVPKVSQGRWKGGHVEEDGTQYKSFFGRGQGSRLRYLGTVIL